MKRDEKMKWLRRPGQLALVMVLGLSATGAVGAGGLAPFDAVDAEVKALSHQADALDTQLQAFRPKVDIGASDTQQRFDVAQTNRQSAQMNLRISQLEEQMRVLNGQVEGLQFQLTQMQTFLERLQEDYDFRFEQLEGSRAGKTSAASQPGGAMLSGGMPQTQKQSEKPSTSLRQSASQDLMGPDAGLLDENSVDGLVLRNGELGLGTTDLNLSGDELDLQLPDDGFMRQGDASAQYRAGYEAVVRGDFDFAEDQFRQFVDLFPKHASAPEAANWLGEALLQRGEFDEAAAVLLKSFQAYSNSTRAPDLLMKLGVALAGAGEIDTACRTFAEVTRRFTNQPKSFVDRLQSEMQAAKC